MPQPIFCRKSRNPAKALSSRLTAFSLKATFKSGQCSGNPDKNACSTFLDSFFALAFAFGRAHSRNASTQLIVFGSLLPDGFQQHILQFTRRFSIRHDESANRDSGEIPGLQRLDLPMPEEICVRPKADAHHFVDFRQGLRGGSSPSWSASNIAPKARSSRKRGSMEITLTALARNSLFPSIS